MRRRLSSALILLVAALPVAAAAKDRVPEDAFAPTAPVPPPAAPANGAIFQGGYVALTSGGRAGRVGATAGFRWARWGGWRVGFSICPVGRAGW